MGFRLCLGFALGFGFGFCLGFRKELSQELEHGLIQPKFISAQLKSWFPGTWLGTGTERSNTWSCVARGRSYGATQLQGNVFTKRHHVCVSHDELSPFAQKHFGKLFHEITRFLWTNRRTGMLPGQPTIGPGRLLWVKHRDFTKGLIAMYSSHKCDCCS